MKKTFSNITVKRLALTGITAATYTVLSMMLPFLAYGEIQCRFSEVLNLLAFVNPVFAPGIILGCFITNIFSPFPLDMLFGVIATALSMFFITRSRSLFIASLWPTVFCVIIGAEIVLYTGAPYLFSKFVLASLSVMAGEFVAVTLIGFPLFKYLLKNQRLTSFLKSL